MIHIPLDLVEGILLERPNRFLFRAQIAGREVLLHCPATGKIGHIDDFAGMKCLCSLAENASQRRTIGTVEAFSRDGGNFWIGINQTRINFWIGKLLQQNRLSRMIDSENAQIFREKNVGKSRLDFAVQWPKSQAFLELKTPIRDFFFTPTFDFGQPSSAQFFERIIKHYETLAELAKAGHRALVALCFMYDAVPFNPPSRPEKMSQQIMEVACRCRHCGVEQWQINLKFSPKGIALRDYFPLPEWRFSAENSSQ